MVQQLRVAILEADTPVPTITAKRGSYGDIIQDLLIQGAALAGYDQSALSLHITKFEVVTEQKYPDLKDVDAILISGSKHSAYEDHPWITKLVRFTRSALDGSRTKVVGICFGHQIIGRALGARVGKNPAGWEVSVDKVALSESGIELFGRKSLSIHQMHGDAVLSMPSNCQNLGSSPVCAIQGLYRPGKLLSVQGHPEFDGFVVSEIVNLRHKQGIFGTELVEDALGRVARSHDGGEIGAVIVRFMLDK